MDARFDLMSNELGASFGKRFTNVGMVIGQSSLPKATQELVSLRASQVNGCALVCLLAPINTANRFNVIQRNPAGSYEAGMLANSSH
jgi:hypothetical protein